MKRHPVAVAWAVFLVVAALSVAAIWSGAIGPDLDVRSVTSETVAGPHQEVLEIRNDRRLAVTVDDVGLDVPGLRAVSVELIGPDGAPRPYRSVDLEQGDAVQVLLTWREVPCDSGDWHAGSYTVRVRTAIGVRRTMHVERGDHVFLGPGKGPHRFSDRAIARSDVLHRCGFYD